MSTSKSIRTRKPKRIPELSARDITRFWSKINKRGPDECWEWSAARTGGYGAFSYSHSGYLHAHRVAYALHYGDDPIGYFVCHKCDNPPCCNPNHLFKGTHTDNVIDCIRKNRNAFGGFQGAARLNDAEVMDIRNRYASGESSATALAREYSICVGTVTALLHGRTWRHLPNPAAGIDYRFHRKGGRRPGQDTHAKTEDIRDIKRMLLDGAAPSVIAHTLRVSRHLVGTIKSGGWANVW